MTHEINLGGAIYISSKKAADISGYSQDYIGQLARSGGVLAQRVSGLWYIEQNSLKAHQEKAEQYKPVPPIRTGGDAEASVSFDGRDYVSTARAAQLTGYNPDYVSQLARGGKVLSRQVGNRWYVDREALLEHKSHNDALLAAVQAESVGLVRPESDVSPRAAETPTPPAPEQHFSYITENVPLMPNESKTVGNVPQRDPVPEPADNQDDLAQPDAAEEHDIPIRVLEPIQTMPRFEAVSVAMAEPAQSRTWIQYVLITLGIGILFGGVYIAYSQGNFAAVSKLQRMELPPINAESMPAAVAPIYEALREYASRKIEYPGGDSR